MWVSPCMLVVLPQILSCKSESIYIYIYTYNYVQIYDTLYLYTTDSFIQFFSVLIDTVGVYCCLFMFLFYCYFSVFMNNASVLQFETI